MPSASRLSAQLWARRVPQIVGGYTLAAATAVTFTDWTATRFGFSPNIANLLLASVVLLAPTVAYVAYRLGEPEATRWGRRHGVTLSCNAVAVAALLGVLFWGKPLGATTRTVVAENEDGERVERTVAAEAYRKRVGAFYFEAPDGEAWMGQAVAYGLVRDLDQDLFLSARCPCSFAERLRKAGSDDGADVPLALARDVAQRFRLDVFATGRVETTAQGVALDVVLTEARTGRELRAFRAEGADLLDAVDRAATVYRDALALPETHRDETPDLPTRELLTASMTAFRAWAEGEHAVSFEQNAVAAAAHFAAAVEADPTFAKAELDRASALFQSNEWQAAQAALASAEAHRYRLSESDRHLLRMYTFYAARQPAEALAAARQWQALYPDDLRAHAWTASFQASQGDVDGAIASYERALAVDPGEAALHFTLADLLIERGRLEEAEAHYEAYLEAEPDKAAGLQGLAYVEKLRGRSAESLALLRRAVVAEPDNVAAQVSLARSLLANGHDAEAAAGYDRVLALAATPSERMQAYQARSAARLGRGQTRAGLADVDSLFGLYARTSDPASVLSARAAYGPSMVESGLPEQAQAAIAAARASPAFREPGSYRIGVLTYEAWTRALTDDPAGARAALALAEKDMAALGVDAGRSALGYVRGVTEMAAGRPAQAVRAFTVYAKAEPGSPDNWVRLAEAQAAAGQRGAARASLQTALAMAPADPRTNLAAAQLSADDPAQAGRYLRVALRAWASAEPGFRPAQQARALRDRLRAAA